MARTRRLPRWSPPTLPVPTQPGVNVPWAEVAEGINPDMRPGVSDQIDISIQRQLPHDTIVEVGYLGVWAKHLYQGVDLDTVPFMIKSGGQTFAQAYVNVNQALAAGKTRLTALLRKLAERQRILRRIRKLHDRSGHQRGG